MLRERRNILNLVWNRKTEMGYFLVSFVKNPESFYGGQSKEEKFTRS